MTSENSFIDRSASRRRFLAITGGVVLGTSALASGQETTTTESPEPVASYRFGGEVQAWQGQQPEEISGSSNPTLEFQAGQVYEITWENLDGQPHDWAFRDGDGNDLPVIYPDVETGSAGDGTTTETDGAEQTTGEMTTVEPPENAIEVTEQVTEQGATQTFRFVATPEIAQYICTIHPTTMVGEVNVQGGDGGTTTE